MTRPTRMGMISAANNPMCPAIGPLFAHVVRAGERTRRRAPRRWDRDHRQRQDHRAHGERSSAETCNAHELPTSSDSTTSSIKWSSSTLRYPDNGPELVGDFGHEAEAWWGTVWGSPMAAVYVDADVPALRRLASLIDQVTTSRNAGAKGARRGPPARGSLRVVASRPPPLAVGARPGGRRGGPRVLVVIRRRGGFAPSSTRPHPRAARRLLDRAGPRPRRW
jgi:hypothetical protein